MQAVGFHQKVTDNALSAHELDCLPLSVIQEGDIGAQWGVAIQAFDQDKAVLDVQYLAVPVPRRLLQSSGEADGKPGAIRRCVTVRSVSLH